MGKLLELHTDRPKLRYNYTEVVTLLPSEYRRKVTADEGKNRAVGHDLLLWCVTQSTHFLDQTCANVLQFIIARTYGYAKEGELISVNHFITGVFAMKDNRSIIAPAVKDRATVYKALAVLEAAQLIDRTRVTINSADVVSVISVKADAVLSLVMTREQAQMLRESKKQKQLNALEIDAEEGEFAMKNTSSRVGGFPTSRVGGKPTTEDIYKEDIKELSCSVPRNAKRITRSRKIEIDCNDNAATAIAKAVARVTERRESKVRRAADAGGGFISLSALNATWQTVMISTFGHCTFSGLTHKEYGIFKRIAKTHTLSCRWEEFLLWVVQNWAVINKESKEIAAFKKKKTGDWSLNEDSRIFLGTDTPDIFMMTKNFAKLIKRYAQHSLSGRRVRVEESAEVIELRRVVEQVKRESAVSNQLLQKALAAKQESVATARVVRPVRIVNPKNDTFFEEADSTLPEWR